MYSAADLKFRNRIAAAKQAAEQGRLLDAQAAMQQLEREAPGHPLIQNEIAARLLQAGRFSEACTLLAQVVRSESSSVEVWFNYATALRQAGRAGEALGALEKLLAIDPGNVRGLLEKGSLEEQKGEERAAAKTWLAALQLLPPGFQAPPWMEPLLKRARDAVAANNRSLERYIDDALKDAKAQYQDVSFHRFEQCMDTLLYKRRIWRQQPTFMYFPELPTIEFYDRALFPWLDSLDAAFEDIRAELIDVLSRESNSLEPYVRQPGKLWRELTNSRRWSAYHFWREGRPFADHIARCPRTVSAIEACPRWKVPGGGPNAMFSILDAKTRIPAHTGPVNTRLVVHLPLIVPPGCGFRVGGQERAWEPGKAFVFDDSISHEAWNDSNEPRAVLIFDIWSPYLNPAEHALIGVLTERIAEYYGTGPDNSGL